MAAAGTRAASSGRAIGGRRGWEERDGKREGAREGWDGRLRWASHGTAVEKQTTAQATHSTAPLDDAASEQASKDRSSAAPAVSHPDRAARRFPLPLLPLLHLRERSQTSDLRNERRQEQPYSREKRGKPRRRQVARPCWSSRRLRAVRHQLCLDIDAALPPARWCDARESRIVRRREKLRLDLKREERGRTT